jgi:magnesium chelatase family protein
MTPRQVARHCPLSPEGRQLVAQAFDRLGLSARAHDRVLKVARTIADLAGVEEIGVAHLAEALQYRGLDRGVG